VYDQHGKTHTCRVLLDSGAQSNFITESLAKKLKSIRKHSTVTINGISNYKANSYYTVKVRIKSRHTDYTRDVECQVLQRITGDLPQVCIDIKNINIPNNLKLADPHFHMPNRIDMLLGAEIFWELLCGGRLQTHKNQPALQKTQLGWIMGGRIRSNDSVKSNVCNLSIHAEISRRLEKFWELEHITEKSPITPEEEDCMQLFS